ncbi:hypothetical protein SKPI104516_08820 [Skermania piniformis]
MADFLDAPRRARKYRAGLVVRWRLLSIALVAGPALVACGGAAPAKVSTESPAAEEVSTPTVHDLEGWLDHALDPNVPVADKAIYAQGDVADGALVSKLMELYSAEGARIDVRRVARTSADDILVDGNLNVWGKSYSQQVPFVYESGNWKIRMDWACNAAAVIQLSSPACVARGDK